MIRVLHVLGGLNLGGAESRIMDLYRHMDREQVQFDFLVHMDANEYARAIKDGIAPEEYRTEQHYDSEILELGGRIYALPRFKVYNIGAYRRAIRRFFTEHQDYSVVQGHMTSTASIYLPIAKAVSMIHRDESPSDGIIDDEAISRLNIITTVAHTRNAGVDSGIKGYITKLLRKSLPHKADFLFACSHLAGDETFGGAKYTYIPNTIDTGRFVFNRSDRDEIRDLYDIPEDALVIGNVARFSPQKNQTYLIKAYSDLLKRIADNPLSSVKSCYLMLCGDGLLKEQCEQLATDLGVADTVIFTGNQSEVWKYYSAMDIYAFPSAYEGLPGVVVEAQASGLITLMSDTITTDVMVTDEIQATSIAVSPDEWGRRLHEIILAKSRRLTDADEMNKQRVAMAAQVREAGFDVNDQAALIMRFYLNPGTDTLPVR